MPEYDSIRIVIADDHSFLLEGLSQLLKGEPGIEICCTGSNGTEALKAVVEHKPDLLLCDISMPDLNGLELLSRMKVKAPGVPVLFMTMHDDNRTLTAALKAGVNGYLLKESGADELMEAVRSVARGESWFDPRLKEVVLRNLSGGEAKPGQAIPDLTDREMEVLACIASGMTQEEIADKICLSMHTVAFHRRKLLRKFEVPNTAALVRAAMRMGFVE